MENTKPTQTARILDYMQEFGSITQLEAIRDLGIMRLASRISELKKQGVQIDKKTETVKNRFGENTYIKRYSLKKEEQNESNLNECKP
jgi:hypothetical protein